MERDKPKKEGKERDGLRACGYYTKHPHHGSLWRLNPQYRRRKDRERRDQRDNACNLLFSVKIRADTGHLIQHINSKNKNTLREIWSNMVSHYTFYIYCGFWRIQNVVVVVVFIFLFHCRKVILFICISGSSSSSSSSILSFKNVYVCFKHKSNTLKLPFV